MIFALLAIVAALVLLVLRELAAPGPSRIVTAVRRYGVAPYLAAAGVVTLLAVYLARPGWRANLASLALLGGPVVFAATFQRHLLARAVLRARWPSVARSCGLGVRRDVRGRQWPFDATVTIGNEHVEYLPVISRPRAVSGVGVRYTLRPARGGTITDVAEVTEALAAALGLQRVEVTRARPDRGELLAVFR